MLLDTYKHRALAYTDEDVVLTDKAIKSQGLFKVKLRFEEGERYCTCRTEKQCEDIQQLILNCSSTYGIIICPMDLKFIQTIRENGYKNVVIAFGVNEKNGLRALQAGFDGYVRGLEHSTIQALYAVMKQVLKINKRKSLGNGSLSKIEKMLGTSSYRGAFEPQEL